jgi:hypothetical protein
VGEEGNFLPLPSQSRLKEVQMPETFKEEDMMKAEQVIREWKEKFPEAAAALKEVWKANYMKAGHKIMARQLIK